jgi:hypothetical protein
VEEEVYGVKELMTRMQQMATDIICENLLNPKHLSPKYLFAEPNFLFVVIYGKRNRYELLAGKDRARHFRLG